MYKQLFATQSSLLFIHSMLDEGKLAPNEKLAK